LTSAFSPRSHSHGNIFRWHETRLLNRKAQIASLVFGFFQPARFFGRNNNFGNQSFLLKGDTVMTTTKVSVMTLGPGPGDEPVQTKEIIFLTLYLVVLLISLFFGIWYCLPTCRDESAFAPSGTAANSNAVHNTNGRRAANAGDRNSANAAGATNDNANRNVTVVETNDGANANAGNRNTNAAVNNAANSGGADARIVGANANQVTASGANAAPTAQPVKITSITPSSGAVDAGTLLTIKGYGFGKEPKVYIGGLQTEITLPSSNESINLAAPVRSAAGKADVVVANAAGESDVLTAAFTYTCRAVPDSRLFMLVLLAGALGGSIHSMRSLWWYVGNRELLWSWVLMYVLLPLVGAAIAALFFLIVRGGFIPNSAATTDNTLFLIAIAGLVGLFSQQAVLKLQDIANAVLTKPGAGENARPQKSESVGERGGTALPDESENKPLITIKPAKGKKEGSEEVIISGVKSVKSLKFGGEEIDLSSYQFDPATATLKFKTPQRDQTGDVDVIIETEDGLPVKLKYTYE
jgi:hypothetical protein